MKMEWLNDEMTDVLFRARFSSLLSCISIEFDTMMMEIKKKKTHNENDRRKWNNIWNVW